MRGQQPPLIATWLAQRLVAGPRRESLLVDLIEQHRQGRSGVWYCRQVLAAILSGMCTFLPRTRRLPSAP